MGVLIASVYIYVYKSVNSRKRLRVRCFLLWGYSADVIFQQRSLIDAQLAEVVAQAELAIAQANLDLALGIWKK